MTAQTYSVYVHKMWCTEKEEAQGEKTMVNIVRTARRAVLALGVLGSAALIGMGPLSVHAAGPNLQIAAGNCGAYVTGSGFTPSGKVDLYVYTNSGAGWQFNNEYVETASASHWVYPHWVGGGQISQAVYDNNNADTIWVMSYDETANLWSNYTQTTEYCLK
jgi:hypothetical protein